MRFKYKSKKMKGTGNWKEKRITEAYDWGVFRKRGAFLAVSRVFVFRFERGVGRTPRGEDRSVRKERVSANKDMKKKMQKKKTRILHKRNKMCHSESLIGGPRHFSGWGSLQSTLHTGKEGKERNKARGMRKDRRRRERNRLGNS